MSNGNVYERLWKLQSQVNKLVLEGKRDPAKLANIYQAFMEGSVTATFGETYELNLAPGQRNGVMEGYDVEQHLKKMKLIKRCLSLDDLVVKGWLTYPSTYPREFRGKVVFLWRSVRMSSGSPEVANLIWLGDHGVIGWRQLNRDWGSINPAVLRRPAIR